MDNYFIEKEHEIVEKMLQKSTSEMAEFLGLEINHSIESVIGQYKSNMIKSLRK